METLTLYRGDSTRIEEFSFAKTRKYCLVGQGIYLTDKVEVAHSYKTKGTTYRESRVLFAGVAKDRTEAYAKGFEVFFNRKCHNEEGTPYWKLKTLPEKRRLLLEKKYRQEYLLAIEEGRIVANYTVTHTGRPKELEVIWGEEPEYGFLSKFSFPKKGFLDSMIDLHNLRDLVFWEIIFNSPLKVQFEKTSKDTTKSEFFQENYGKNFEGGLPAFKSKEEFFRKVRHITEPWGYRGYKHRGGMMVGGYGAHNAFCVWDEDFVNKHRVSLTGSHSPDNIKV